VVDTTMRTRLKTCSAVKFGTRSSLALFRLTRREKVVEPPKDRSADDAIHQRIDRPGNDRAHPGARTVAREDGPEQLKKCLPVARPDHVGCRNKLHKRPEAIDIAVILSRMLPPFENRGLELRWFNSVTLTANCNYVAGIASRIAQWANWSLRL